MNKHKNAWKIDSNVCPNVVVYFGGGVSWTTFGAPIRSLIRKMHPTCVKCDSNVPKLTPKMVPKWWKRLAKSRKSKPNRMCLEICMIAQQNWTKCSNWCFCKTYHTTLKQKPLRARRTARSALILYLDTFDLCAFTPVRIHTMTLLHLSTFCTFPTFRGLCWA